MLDRDSSGWRDDQIHHRIVGERRKSRFNDLAIVADSDDRCAGTYNAQLGKNRPFEVEVAVPLAEPDTIRADGRGSRDQQLDWTAGSQLCQAQRPGIKFNSVQSRSMSSKLGRNCFRIDIQKAA